ncbi:hypothetical protein CYMTET_9208, partial [Cymbomonas tetramitiformis]
VLVLDLLTLMQDDAGRAACDAFFALVFTRHVVVGYGLQGDVWKLAESYPRLSGLRHVPLGLDLEDLAAAVYRQQCAVDPAPPTPKAPQSALPQGLAGLTRWCLRRRMDKTLQLSAWAQRPLSVEQLRYAALDAYVVVQLAQALLVDAVPASSPGPVPTAPCLPRARESLGGAPPSGAAVGATRLPGAPRTEPCQGAFQPGLEQGGAFVASGTTGLQMAASAAKWCAPVPAAPLQPCHVRAALHALGVSHTIVELGKEGQAVAELPGLVVKTLALRIEMGTEREPLLAAAVLSQDRTLNLAAVATTCGVPPSRVRLAGARELVPLFGYVRGALGPVGLRSNETVIILDAELLDSSHAILCGAGKANLVFSLSPMDLRVAVGAKVANIHCDEANVPAAGGAGQG